MTKLEIEFVEFVEEETEQTKVSVKCPFCDNVMQKGFFESIEIAIGGEYECECGAVIGEYTCAVRETEYVELQDFQITD